MSVHSVSLKGKRESNEDKHTIILNLDSKDKKLNNINYYAIFDGHGGKFVSKFLSNNIQNFFTDKRVKYPLSKGYVMSAFNCLQNTLQNKYNEQSTNCGSTSLILIHFKDNKNTEYLNVMNTGDCRAIISRNNIAYALTNDHKPNKPEEKIRIQNLGGTIRFDGYDWRINDLSVSRAFGDNESKDFVTHIPDLYKYKIGNNDKFIVMGCDGLWDVLDNQHVVDFVTEKCYNIDTNERINKKFNIAKQLAEHAINSGSTDNVSVLVIFLK